MFGNGGRAPHNCPYFDEWRWEAGRQLRRTLSTRLGQSKLHDRTVDIILRKAELFYTCDSDIWPLGDSQYYLGLVPKMQDWLREEGLGSLETPFTRSFTLRFAGIDVTIKSERKYY